MSLGTDRKAKAGGVAYSPQKVIGARALELALAAVRPLLTRSATPPLCECSFLIVEPFGLGDLVAATAILRSIRQQFPRARIAVACHDRWAAWVRQLPFVDCVRSHRFPWSTDPKRLRLRQIRELGVYLRQLRRDHFDVGIDIRGDIRSQGLLIGAGCPIRVGFRDYMGSNIVQRGLLLTHYVDCGVRSRLEELRDLLEVLGIDSGPMMMDLGRQRTNRDARPAPRVGIHVGAGWRFKKWSIANWRLLASALATDYGAEIELLGSPSDEAELRAIAVAGDPGISVVTTGTVNGMVERVADLDLLICHDSAPVHVGAALGVPVIALFGPGDVTRWGRLAESVISLHHQERFRCAPCTQTRCVSPTDTCVNSIEPWEVFNAAQRILGTSTKRADAVIQLSRR